MACSGRAGSPGLNWISLGQQPQAFSVCIFNTSITSYIYFFYSTERGSPKVMTLLNQTLQSAIGIGWMGSWTGWRTSCPFTRRFALGWTSCRSFASAWDTWGSRATSKVRISLGEIPAKSVAVSPDIMSKKCQYWLPVWVRTWPLEHQFLRPIHHSDLHTFTLHCAIWTTHYCPDTR